MADLSCFGIAVDIPPGWDARLYTRNDGGVPRAGLHAATFPLPNERGDFGSGAVETMRRDDVLVVLLEYDRARSTQSLFSSQGVPSALDPASFSAGALQRAMPGHGGAQAFFAAEGRAFCLYVVIGRLADRDRLVGLANQVIGSIRVSPE